MSNAMQSFFYGLAAIGGGLLLRYPCSDEKIIKRRTKA